MAVKKEFIMGLWKGLEELSVVSLENEIDRVLIERKATFASGEPIKIHLNSFVTPKMGKELKQRYGEAGWEVEFEDDPNKQGNHVIILS